MRRIGEFRGVPWRGLVATAIVTLALTAELAQLAGAMPASTASE